MKICLDKLDLLEDELQWEPLTDAFPLFHTFCHPRVCYWCRQFDNSFRTGVNVYYCLDTVILRNGKMFDAWRICCLECYRKRFYPNSWNDPQWVTKVWEPFRQRQRDVFLVGCYNRNKNLEHWTFPISVPPWRACSTRMAEIGQQVDRGLFECM